MNPARRPLRYASFDAIMPDVERLLAGEPKLVGHWTLGQICDHLATVNRMYLDLPADTPNDPALRVGPEQKAQVFASGQLPEEAPLPPHISAPEAVTPEEGARRLRESIAYYQASPTGPVVEHRRLGPLTRAEWDELLCIHCAHHLSFAIPQAV